MIFSHYVYEYNFTLDVEAKGRKSLMCSTGIQISYLNRTILCVTENNSYCCSVYLCLPFEKWRIWSSEGIVFCLLLMLEAERRFHQRLMDFRTTVQRESAQVTYRCLLDTINTIPESLQRRFGLIQHPQKIIRMHMRQGQEL